MWLLWRQWVWSLFLLFLVRENGLLQSLIKYRITIHYNLWVTLPCTESHSMYGIVHLICHTCFQCLQQRGLSCTQFDAQFLWETWKCNCSLSFDMPYVMPSGIEHVFCLSKTSFLTETKSLPKYILASVILLIKIGLIVYCTRRQVNKLEEGMVIWNLTMKSSTNNECHTRLDSHAWYFASIWEDNINFHRRRRLEPNHTVSLHWLVRSSWYPDKLFKLIYDSESKRRFDTIDFHTGQGPQSHDNLKAPAKSYCLG